MTTRNYAPGERTYEAIQLWIDNENASVARAKNLWDAMTDNMRMAWSVAERDAQRDLLDALIYARRFLNSEDHDTAYIDAAIAKAVQP